MTKLCNIIPLRMKNIIDCFLIHNKIDIIKLHVVKPLQSVKQAKHFTNIHRAHIWKAHRFRKNKSSFVIMQTHIDTCTVPLSREWGVNITLNLTTLWSLPSGLSCRTRRRWQHYFLHMLNTSCIALHFLLLVDRPLRRDLRPAIIY